MSIESNVAMSMTVLSQDIPVMLSRTVLSQDIPVMLSRTVLSKDISSDAVQNSDK